MVAIHSQKSHTCCIGGVSDIIDRGSCFLEVVFHITQVPREKSSRLPPDVFNRHVFLLESVPWHTESREARNAYQHGKLCFLLCTTCLLERLETPRLFVLPQISSMLKDFADRSATKFTLLSAISSGTISGDQFSKRLELLSDPHRDLSVTAPRHGLQVAFAVPIVFHNEWLSILLFADARPRSYSACDAYQLHD